MQEDLRSYRINIFVTPLVTRSMWKIDNKVTYLYITYTIENRNSNEVQFFSMSDVYWGNYFFYVPAQNFIFSEDTFMGTNDAVRIDHKPNELRHGEIGFIVGGKLPTIPSQISFTTTSVLNGVSHQIIHKAVTFTINLNE